MAHVAVVSALNEPTEMRRLAASAAVVDLDRVLATAPSFANAQTLVLAAQFQQQIGAHAEALSLALAALQMAQLVRDVATKQKAFSMTGSMLADSGAVADGLVNAISGLDTAVQLADPEAASDAWSALAAALLATGHTQSALIAAGHALTLGQLSADPVHATRAMCLSALASLYLDDVNSALRMARQCVGRLEHPVSLEDHVLRSIAEHHYSRGLARSGRVGMARQRAELAFRHATGCGSSLALAYASIAVAMCDSAEGAHETALARLEGALAQRVPQVLLPAMHALVEAARRLGDRELMIVARERLYAETRRRQQSATRLEADLSRLAVVPARALATFEGISGFDTRSSAVTTPADPLDRLEDAVCALEAREHPTGVGRLYRCGQVAALIATDLGWAPAQIAKLERAARLHAIGKLYVPPEIFGKPGELTAGERALVQRSFSLGVELLRAAGLREERTLWDVVECVGERWDGAGARKFAGEKIPAAARVVAVAAAYVSLTSARPFRKSLSHAEAVNALRRGAGTRFDPQLVDRAIGLLEGSRLQTAVQVLDSAVSNRYALVRQRLQYLLEQDVDGR